MAVAGASGRSPRRRHHPGPVPTSPVEKSVADLTRLDLALAAADVGSFDWDIVTGELVWDDRLRHIFGLGDVGFELRIETFYGLVLPDDLPDVLAAVQGSIDTCGDYVAEYRVRRPDGTIRWVEARGRVLAGPQGRPVRMLGVARDSTDGRRARDAVLRVLEHMADAFVAVDGDWLVTFLNRHAESLLGVDHAAARGRSLWDVWPDLTTSGYVSAFHSAMGTGEPVTVVMYVVETDRWFQLRLVPDRDGLSVFAIDVTAARAADLERSRDVTRPEQARRVLAYSAALAEAVSVRDVTDVVATMVLGAFDGAGMLVSLADSGKLRLAGSTGYSPVAMAFLDGLPLDAVTPVTQVMRTREPLFLPSRQAYLGAFPDRIEAVEAGDKQAWAFLPLTVSGRALGTLTISFDHPRDFAPEERSLLVSVGGLLAQTLERARLRDAERSLAAELQQHLLPRALPQPSGLTATARYLPATEGIQVGGDWYELLELPGERVGLVIGDVQGHNVHAAAVMGQLRNALRAYAAEGHEPAVVMSRTNRLMAELDPAIFATCCLLVLDLRTGTAEVVQAGHPPPVVRGVDGHARVLSAPVGLPFGVDPDETYLAAPVLLAPGETVVLYTDGLVEGARRPFDEGLAAVLAILESTPTEDLDELADALMSGATGAALRADDIAVLVVRHDGRPSAGSPTIARMSVDRADPRAAREARDFIAGQLGHWGLDGLHDTTVLLVSEVVTNALRHTRGRVDIELCRLPGRVRVEVSDEAATPPTLFEMDLLAESGRGVPLMDALSDQWGTAPRGDGKVVWFTLFDPEAEPLAGADPLAGGNR